MSKETLENLSCLMDGEVPSDAGRFLVRRVSADAELGDTWQRYHLIRDCLRRPGETVALSTFRIDPAELESEAESVSERNRAPRWLRPLSGGAIAASVAAAAIAVVVNLNPGGSVSPESQATPFASPNSAGLAPISQPASFNPVNSASQQQLNRYLLRHNQAAGAVSPQGFMTLVPIVTTVTVEPPTASDPTPEEPLPAEDSTP